jgi:hypothetical protein
MTTMIQFRRGSTVSWKKLKTPLAAGQPGYDTTRHKIKVGDGKNLWDKLPYASISEEEVFDSELNARLRLIEDPESLAIITYGTQGPDNKTVGKVYLQQYETDPEVDYVTETGINGIWEYRKWNSGKAECFGALEFSTAIQNSFESKVLFYNDTNMTKKDYPFNFVNVPKESATIQSPGNLVWLAGKAMNTKSATGEYYLISPYKCDNTKYKIVLHVSGHWK